MTTLVLVPETRVEMGQSRAASRNTIVEIAGTPVDDGLARREHRPGRLEKG
jgi:hypothetical protein